MKWEVLVVIYITKFAIKYKIKIKIKKFKQLFDCSFQDSSAVKTYFWVSFQSCTVNVNVL